MKLTKPAAWSDIALGIWLLSAPSVIGFQFSRPITVVEDVLPGIALCLLSLLILAMRLRPLYLEWLQLVCGLWLIAGSVALVFSSMPRAALNGVAVGAAAMVLSLMTWGTDRQQQALP